MSAKPHHPWISAPIALSTVVLFALQHYWGGTANYFPALFRMGAAIRDPIAEGDFGRLLSYAFLHDSPLFLCNALVTFVLYAHALEPLLGAARFLIVWTLGCLFGALFAMVTRGDHALVGSTAGLWSFFGAGLAIWLTDAGRRYTNHAKISWSFVAAALLNATASMAPSTHRWAHIGGVTAGLAIGFSGALFDESTENNQEETTSKKFSFRWSKVLLVLCCFFWIGATTQSLRRGRAWVLRGSPRNEWVTIGSSEVEVLLPSMLAPEWVEYDDHVIRALYGDGSADPMQIFVTVSQLPSRSQEDTPAELIADMAGGLSRDVLDGTRRIQQARIRQSPEGLLVTALDRYPDGYDAWRHWGARGRYEVRIRAEVRPGTPNSWAAFAAQVRVRMRTHATQ